MPEVVEKTLEKTQVHRQTLRHSADIIAAKAKTELVSDARSSQSLAKLIHKLEAKMTEIRLNDDAIRKLIPEVADVEKDSQEAVEFADEIDDVLYDLKIELEALKKKTESLKQKRDDPKPVDSYSNTKLPEVQLSKFNGNPLQWNKFWASFEVNIHLNSKLPDKSKLAYLLGLLEAEAANSIDGYAISDENYATVVKILTDRFGDKTAIIAAHYRSLDNLTPVREMSSIPKLRALVDKCGMHVRSLINLGAKSEVFNAAYASKVKGAMPPHLGQEFTSKNPEKKMDLVLFLEFMENAVKVAEESILDAASYMNKPSKTEVKIEDIQKSLKKKPHHFSPVLTITNEISCIFCSKTDHTNENCPQSIEERRETVKTQRRCFNCLALGHKSEICRSRYNCRKCRSRHHTAVCNRSEAVVNVTTVVNSVSLPLHNVNLQTLLVRVFSGGRTKVVKCLFDTGSERSFILDGLVREMRFSSHSKQDINITTFGSRALDNSPRYVYRVPLACISSTVPTEYVNCLNISNITRPIQQVSFHLFQQALTRQGLLVEDFPISSVSEVSILIGMDFYCQLMTKELTFLSDSLIAWKSKLGWTLMGSSESNRNAKEIQVNCVHVNEVGSQLKRFWELESLGIHHERTDFDELGPRQVLEKFDPHLKLENKRYSVKLPWRLNKSELNDNYRVTEQRFWGTVRKLQRNPKLLMSCREVFSQQLKLGIIELVEGKGKPEGTYYLPHRPVVKENRVTTKVRLVFDASSHAKNQFSLNDCLFKGPNLLPDLLRLLFVFRRFSVAFTADIKQAFHQIAVDVSDRDALRFLWIPEDWDGRSPFLPLHYRFTRVLFGATSSPFILNIAIQKHLKDSRVEFSGTVDELKDKFYVDDLVNSVPNVDSALELQREIVSIMKDASMELTKWRSNQGEFQRFVNDLDPESQKLLDPTVSSVLGVVWHPLEDSLSLAFEVNPETISSLRVSKRVVLQTVASIFDPLGFSSPFAIIGKMLFQELWKRSSSWDDDVPSDLFPRWFNWVKQLPLLRSLVFNRYLGLDPQEGQFVEIHCFCDASPLAYGVVVFIRVLRFGKVFSVSFCLAKSRVAPLKTLTLPRLELMSALLLSKIVPKLAIFSPDRFCLWTDSMITLFWITNDRPKTKQFVRNRVREIRNTTDPSCWRHCPGKFNPADKLTRGVDLSSLIIDTEWREGPDWLKLPETEWPLSNTTDLDISEINSEENGEEIAVNLITFYNPIEFARFGKWSKLVRTVAWCLRFVFRILRRPIVTGPLTTEEILKAEVYVVKLVQREKFYEQMQSLSLKSDSTTFLNNVSIYLDSEGLLRVKGRLHFAPVSLNSKHPLLLDKSHHVTHLIINDCHNRVSHLGVESTLAEFRTNFWCQHSRQFIKTHISHCIKCRRVNGRLSKQVLAPLPFDRVNPSDSFSTSGVDFAGPLYLSDKSKCYVALFTCAVTRAVHLELLSDMSSERFILSFKRFISRRGIPKIMYSDNAKTFKRSERDLSLLLNHVNEEPFQNFLATSKITWKYIAELAPWWGGFWERMVKTVKFSLKKVLGSASADFELLTTILIELEAVINSRPLTFVHAEPEEQEPLTPSHFLIGRRLTTLPDVFCERTANSLSTKPELLKRWKHRQHLMTLLWRRWRKEYVVSLREFKSVKKVSKFCEDQVVIIEDPNVPRMRWMTGRINKVYHGRDGNVRSCEITLPFGKTIKRAVQRLCILEGEE